MWLLNHLTSADTRFMYCLSVFDNFVGLVLKGLMDIDFSILNVIHGFS